MSSSILVSPTFIKKRDATGLFHNVVKFVVILAKTIVDCGQTGKHYHLRSLRLSCITWRKSVRITTRIKESQQSADFLALNFAEKRVSKSLMISTNQHDLFGKQTIEFWKFSFFWYSRLVFMIRTPGRYVNIKGYKKPEISHYGYPNRKSPLH